MNNKENKMKSLFTTQTIKATLILAGGIAVLSNGITVQAEENNVDNDNVATIQSSSSLSSHERAELRMQRSGRLPVDKQNYRLTSHFGPRIDPITKQQGSFHNGLDISAAGISGANIYSVLPGRVIESNYRANGLGHYVVIEHDKGFTTTYAHMQQSSRFRVGDTVSTDDVIGSAGTTGRSTGPHLHLEMTIDGSKVNPYEFLKLAEGIKTESYTVVRGDTLSKIAKEFDTTVAKLKQDNNLNSDLILVGQRLEVNKIVEDEEEPIEEVTIPATSVKETPQGGENIPLNTTYRIKSGDTLYKIANKHNTSVNSIKSLNNLKSNLIITGRTLNIPGAKSESSLSQPVVQESQETKTTTHRVVSGDTLYRLAMKHGTTVSRLKSFNNLTSDLIVVGQVLTIK